MKNSDTKILLICIFLSFAFLLGCKKKIEYPFGNPDNSTPESVVESALEYQLKYAKEYSLEIARVISESYLTFHKQIKNILTDKESEKYSKEYAKFEKFQKLLSDLTKLYETSKIEVDKARTIKFDAKSDYKLMTNFIYENLLALRKSTFQEVSEISDEQEIRKQNVIFFQQANQYLKTLGITEEIFSEDYIQDINELIFAYPQKLEPATKIFRIVPAKFNRPIFDVNTDKISVEDVQKDFLVFQSADNWFLNNFEISTFEVIDESFSNINFYELPDLDFANSTTEQTIESAVKLFLISNSRFIAEKTLHAAVKRYSDIIKNLEINSAWSSKSQDNELIEKYKASFEFMLQNAKELIKYNYKILSEEPKSESEKVYKIQLETKNFRENRNAGKNQPKKFVLENKTEQVTITLKSQNGNWLIANISKN